MLIPDHAVAEGEALLSGETFHIGSVADFLCGSLRDFLLTDARAVLDSAGVGGVSVIDHLVSLETIFESLLLHDPTSTGLLSRGPAIAWVSPRTFTLSRRAQTSIRSISESMYGLPYETPGHQLQLPGSTSLHVPISGLAWRRPPKTDLTVVARNYQSSYLLEWPQFSIAPMRDDADSKAFFVQNDVVPAHEGHFVDVRGGRPVYSRHPFIAVGRLRPKTSAVPDVPWGGSTWWRHCDAAFFDYLLVVLGAENDGIVSVSRVSVQFARWIANWPHIRQSIVDRMTSGMVHQDDATRDMLLADIENVRGRLMKRLGVWRAAIRESQREDDRSDMWHRTRGLIRFMLDTKCFDHPGLESLAVLMSRKLYEECLFDWIMGFIGSVSQLDTGRLHEGLRATHVALEDMLADFDIF